MAFLDVSTVLLDPDFTDNFSVTRRQETVDNNGFSTVVPVTTQQIGVVTAASPNQLDRLAEADIFKRAINVVTKFKLQGEVVGYKPDLVVWRGDNYIVKEIDLYPQYGAGFIQALCVSEDLVDAAT